MNHCYWWWNDDDEKHLNSAALYILNWIWRYYTQDYYDMIAIGAGVIQTFLYLDFFYIYFMNGYGVRKHEQLQTVVV